MIATTFNSLLTTRNREYLFIVFFLLLHLYDTWYMYKNTVINKLWALFLSSWSFISFIWCLLSSAIHTYTCLIRREVFKTGFQSFVVYGDIYTGCIIHDYLFWKWVFDVVLYLIITLGVESLDLLSNLCGFMRNALYLCIGSL